MKYTPPGKKFGQLLVQHGFISKERLEEALHHQETTAPHKPLGELCVELGFISSVVLKVVLDRYRKGKLLGKVLLDMGVISVDQLREALSEQKMTGNRLGHIFLEQHSITKAELAQALSIQLGIPKIVPNAHMVDQTLISRANAEYFRKHRVVPLGRGVTSDNRSKEIVTVLMEDPLDMTTLAELEKIFNAEIRPAVSASIDVDDFLHEIFDPWARYPVSNEADSVGAPSDYNHDTSREVTDLTRMRPEERSVPIPAKQGDEVLSALPVIRTAATVPDVPTTGDVVMTEPAEDSPSLGDLAPGTRMRPEESRSVLNPAHQNIAREVEQDRAAEAEVLSPVLPRATSVEFRPLVCR